MNADLYRKTTHIKLIFKQIGGLLIVLGYAMIIPMLVALIYAEFYSALGFLLSGMISLGLGYTSYKGIRSIEDISSHHALVIAALGWFAVVVMGAVPYTLIAFITPEEAAMRFIPDGADFGSSLWYFKNPLHAIFESMSGFTTTGLSMAVHEPTIGKGLLFYRHFTQFLGGAGFVVLTLALLKQSSGKIAYLLYGSESTGERLQSTILETARSIWKVYIGVTAFSFVFLVVGTLIILPDYSFAENIFDSINHAMAGQSTGGFSTLDDSISGYHSAAMEALYLVPMILGALSLTFYFRVIQERKISYFWKDIQTRSILILTIVGSMVLSLMLMATGYISEPFRVGTFQFVSALTTTGWQTTDVHQWDSGSILFISLIAMVIGGAYGSTVGGIKMIRVLLIFKGLFWQINNIFSSERSIKVVKFNGKRLLPEEMNKDIALVATFVFIYLIFLMTGTLISYYTMGEGFELKHALFESASAQGTVGLSCGITHPDMSIGLEITYILQMWVGRLEIIPVLVLFRSVFAGTKPKIV